MLAKVLLRQLGNGNHIFLDHKPTLLSHGLERREALEDDETVLES
jgi:hypothetical protein